MHRIAISSALRDAREGYRVRSPALKGWAKLRASLRDEQAGSLRSQGASQFSDSFYGSTPSMFAGGEDTVLGPAEQPVLHLDSIWQWSKCSKKFVGGESLMCYASHYCSRAPGKHFTLRRNWPHNLEFKRLCHPKGHDRLEAAPGPTADFSSGDQFRR